MSNPMDYRVHGILQARILESVTFPFSRVTSQHKDGTQVSQPRSPALWADSFPPESQGSPRILEWVSYSFYRASSRPRNPTRVSCLQAGFFFLPTELSSQLNSPSMRKRSGLERILPSPPPSRTSYLTFWKLIK